MAVQKNLTKGSVIGVCRPFAYVVATSKRGIICDVCLEKSPSLKTCTKCKTAYYCDRKCQKSGWEDHKLECKSFQRVHPRMPPDHVLLLARIIRKLQRGGDRQSETIGNVTRVFADLQSHCKEIRNDAVRCEVFQSAYFVLTCFLGEDLEATRVFEVLGKTLINSMDVVNWDNGESLASALYLAASIFDHSCCPNVFAYFDGPELTLISMENHNEFDIGKLRISYIDIMDTRTERRKKLQESYYFHCECPSCLNDDLDKWMHSLQCENTTCDQMLYLDSEKCSKCQTPLQAGTKAQAKNLMQILPEKVKEAKKHMDDKRLDDAFTALADSLLQTKLLLHPYNAFYINVTDEAFIICILQHNWPQALEYGVALLKGFTFHYGETMDTLVIVRLAKLGKIQLLLGLDQEGAVTIRKAISIAEAVFGPGHKVTASIKAGLQPL